jgi:hypothetical protein
VNTKETELQRLKIDIEGMREKLNLQIEQDAPNITGEILNTSRKLDKLIVNYYHILIEREV